MKRFLIAYVLPTLLIMVWAVLPLLRGTHTLYLRDVFNTHLEKKWVQAEAMRDGYLPLVDPYRDGGQPHAGNPNSVPFYPDNLLFLVAPTFWAFNAHFWLHLLLAPLAFFWLGRAWGLRREAAWAAGVCFAASGYLLSNLNLYNLVAGTVWAPALIAAMLRLSAPNRGRRSFLAAGLIWTLLLLAGDPMTALIAVFLGVLAVGMQWGLRAPRWHLVLGALALGTLVAAPQWVEFLRILPMSFRGYLGYSEAAAMAASWPPIGVMEWFVPFVLGLPDLSYWGQSFHGGDLPLFPTLYPGVLTLILVLGSGKPASRGARWAWLVVGLGIFLALGEHNIAVKWLLRIPGAGLMRLPVKFWLLVAVGGSLLAGLGFQRLVLTSEGRRLRQILLGLFLLFLLIWLGVGGAEGVSPDWLVTLLSGSLEGEALDRERLRWAGLCLISMAAVLVYGVVFRIARSKLELAGAGLLTVHVALQLILLRPALAMDEVSFYRQPPDLLAQVPVRSLVAHGGASSLFGPSELLVADYPDTRLSWLERQVFEELHPVAGTLWGRRYEFSLSPEGLDGFLTRAAAQTFQFLSDVERVRLLAASGVNIVLLNRKLGPEVGDLVKLRHRRSTVGGEILVYEVDAAAPVKFVGKVLRAPHLNAALGWLTGEDFDPQTTVVLPPGGPALEGPPGEVTVVREGPESMELTVKAPGPGALVIQKAFLPIYRAEANGRPVPIVAANIHRLGIELTEGTHQVEIWVDRRQLVLSSLLAVAGLVALVFITLRLQ